MESGSKGRLKIFFSYADSIGKTQAMIEAAATARTQGVDVVVGCMGEYSFFESHKQSQDAELEVLPALVVNGMKELDLDGALSRKPELILIDNLALSNPAGG